MNMPAVSDISIKITLCILFILGGTWLGFRSAARLTKRKNAISDIIAGLYLFENEIYYTRERLESIAARLGRISAGAAAEFFSVFAGLLEERSELGAEFLWNEAADICFPPASTLTASTLNKKDTEALRALGVKLGTTDVEGQRDNIGRTIKELSLRLADAEEMERQKGKMYRTVGAAAGILCAVLIV